MTNFLLSTLADVFFPEYIQLAKLFCCASQIQALCIIKCLYVCMYVPMYVVITKLKVLVHGNSFVVYVMLCYTVKRSLLLLLLCYTENLATLLLFMFMPSVL